MPPQKPPHQEQKKIHRKVLQELSNNQGQGQHRRHRTTKCTSQDDSDDSDDSDDDDLDDIVPVFPLPECIQHLYNKSQWLWAVKQRHVNGLDTAIFKIGKRLFFSKKRLAKAMTAKRRG